MGDLSIVKASMNATSEDDINKVVTCNANSKCIEAFRLMVDNNVSAVPIVDANGELLVSMVALMVEWTTHVSYISVA